MSLAHYWFALVILYWLLFGMNRLTKALAEIFDRLLDRRGLWHKRLLQVFWRFIVWSVCAILLCLATKLYMQWVANFDAWGYVEDVAPATPGTINDGRHNCKPPGFDT